MKIRSVLLGTVVSVLITAAAFFVIAAISYFTDVSASLTNILFYLSAAVGVFCGAFIAARKSKSKVLFHSLSVSILCLLLIVVFSFAINGTLKLDMHFLSVTAATLFAGFLGAIAGK